MLVLAGLIVAFFLSRLINLTLLPIFADEAIYIRWSQVILKGKYFIPLTDGKTPLFMWLLAPFLKLGVDPLVAGRLLSVFSGLATLLGVYFLTKKLFDKPIALLASALVVLNPFLLFYDRLSLVDSMLTAIGVWSFYLAYQLFQKPTLKQGILLGFFWLAALLTKPSGIYYPVLTPFFFLLFPPKNWLKKIKSLILPVGLAGIIGLGLYQFLRLSDAYHLIALRSADYLRTLPEILNTLFEFFPQTLAILLSWLTSYFSLPALIILILSLALAIRHRSKKILLLSLWVLIPFFSQIIIGKIIRPRYFLPIAPFLLIIISWTVFQAKKVLNLTAIALLGLALLFWLQFDGYLLTNPVKAPLNSSEKEQYLEEWSAGFGIKEITQYLNNLPQDQSALVLTEGSFGTLPNGLEIYFDNSDNITILGVGFPKAATSRPSVTQAFNQGKSVYIVANHNRFSFGDQSRLKLIAEYPRVPGKKGQQKLMFYQVQP